MYAMLMMMYAKLKKQNRTKNPNKNIVEKEWSQMLSEKNKFITYKRSEILIEGAITYMKFSFS